MRKLARSIPIHGADAFGALLLQFHLRYLTQMSCCTLILGASLCVISLFYFQHLCNRTVTDGNAWPSDRLPLNHNGGIVVLTPWTLTSAPMLFDRAKETMGSWARQPIIWWPLEPRGATYTKGWIRVSWFCAHVCLSREWKFKPKTGPQWRNRYYYAPS